MVTRDDKSSGVQTFDRLSGMQQPDYRRIVENSPDFVVRSDLNGRHLYLSPNLLAFFGLNQIDVIGKLPNELWPDGRYAEIEKTSIQVVETGKPAVERSLYRVKKKPL